MAKRKMKQKDPKYAGHFISNVWGGDRSETKTVGALPKGKKMTT